MNKIQELIQQKLALEIANKAIQIAGLEAQPIVTGKQIGRAHV